MDPLAQALFELRRLSAMPLPVSNMALIRGLVRDEFQRLEAPSVMSFIGDDDRELFEKNKDQVQAFLESADGADAWGLVVEAFRAYVEPPVQDTQPSDGLE